MNAIAMNILMKIIAMTMMVVTIESDCYYPLVVYSIHGNQDVCDDVQYDIHDNDYDD